MAHRYPQTPTSCPYTDLSSDNPMIRINCKTSRSVWTLKVNPFTGTTKVRWFNGPITEYQYKCSKRAILALMIAHDRSLGQWVNWHCVAA